MENRPKLELLLNESKKLTLLFDDPITGESRYGKYNMYAVKDEDGVEYSFFATDEVHEQIKTLKKGDAFSINKTAEQKGSKIITRFNLELQKNGNGKQPTISGDKFFEALLQSYEDSLKLQERFNGMVDVNRVAITLFIARSKLNGREVYS